MCKQIKKDGSQCEAMSISNSEFCFFHHPDMDLAKKEAQSNGGKANKIAISAPLPVIKIEKIEDVISLLSETINLVRQGEDVKWANCIGVLSGYLIKAIETSQLENRFEVVEKAVMEKRTISYNK
jgi:hypothetical protein